MSKRLDETIGAVGYDGLIVDNIPAADVASVSIAGGSGTLKRGTVVTGTPGGEMAPLAAAATATDALYILTDEVDASGETAVVTTAYRTGHFARGKLIVGEGYTLSEADEELLRKSGILLSAALDY